MQAFPKTKFPFVIVLDNIRSALNVGAIFRTCDGAGVSKLYLCGITPYPPHNRIPKTALGASEYVEWERFPNTIELLQKLKEEGYTLVSVEQTPNSKPYFEVEYPEKTALIFGHEISGVNDEVVNLSDIQVEVPMFGQKNSLNVATTAGILSYHLAMQYLK
jgi:23S rRNA (guanosine2251-2'-O)-methyltransferase